MTTPETTIALPAMKAHKAWRYYCSQAPDAREFHQLNARTFQRLYSGAATPPPGIAREAAARMDEWLARGERPDANPLRIAGAAIHLRKWASRHG